MVNPIHLLTMAPMNPQNGGFPIGKMKKKYNKSLPVTLGVLYRFMVSLKIGVPPNHCFRGFSSSSHDELWMIWGYSGGHRKP